MYISGISLTLGDDINTDLIYPGKYLTIAERSEQALHALEGLGNEWPQRLRTRNIVSAGWNLGCGSSREQAATALLGAGVRLVVARSMARLFLRNCINNGLPIIESDELGAALIDGARIGADLRLGTATVDARVFRFEPLPEALLDILREGGLLARLRRRLHQGA